MTTSWELIMAAHTSWHSSEAASGDHWCKVRAENQTCLVCRPLVSELKVLCRTAAQVRRQPTQRKEGSPPGVSLLTTEKSPGTLRFRGIIFLIDVDALFLRQCLCCLLPNVGTFFRSYIHLASFRNVECLIEVRHRAESAGSTGFVWRMHVFFDL